VPSAYPSIQIKNGLKKVDLCGDTYLSKQIVVDDIDVVQKVARIVVSLDKEKQQNFCESLERIQEGCRLIPSDDEIHIAIFKEETGFYGFGLSLCDSKVDSSSGLVYKWPGSDSVIIFPPKNKIEISGPSIDGYYPYFIGTLH
jgi:hypothetical protein